MNVDRSEDRAPRGSVTPEVDRTGPLNIEALICAAAETPPVKQTDGGNYERIQDADHDVGIDYRTQRPTPTYTVITEPNGALVTAFPGVP